MRNKLLSIILVMLIGISMLPAPVLGAATDYGLSVNATDNRAGRIALGDDCIYVYSHISAFQQAYYVSSDNLVESLSSSVYSNIEYVDSSKQKAKVSRVSDGYIKLYNSSSDAVYLPIKTNSENIVSEDFSCFDGAKYYQRYDDGTSAKERLITDFNGKGEKDISYVIDGMGDSNIYPNGEGYNVYLQRSNVFTSNTVSTIDVSFCNSSDACANIFLKMEAPSNSINVIKVDSEGNAYIDGKYVSYLAPDVWHDVSITFDYTRNQLLVFADGAYLGEVYRQVSGKKLDYMKFEMQGDKDSDGNPVPAYGEIAYDDFCVYGGYPRNIDNLYPKLSSDDYCIDNENRIIYGAIGDSKDDVLNVIKCGSNGSVSLDDSCVDTSSVAKVSVTDSYGRALSASYTFSDDTYISPVQVVNRGETTVDDIVARITAVSGSNDTDSEAIMALAVYKNNELKSINLQKADINSKTDFEANVILDREENESARVFLWNSNLKPIYERDISESSLPITVFESDYEYEELMSDYIAIHSRSGLLTAYGEKTLLANKPYTEDDVLYIPPKEVSDILGISCSVSSSVVTVNGKSLRLDPAKSKNGIAYMSAKTYFESFLSLVTTDFTSATNSGIIIAGSDKFVLPAFINAQKLNNYLFNLRPSKNDIKEMYKASSLKGQHPRIYIDSADLLRIKSEIETNPYKKSWGSTIIAAANWDITRPIVSYVIDDGGRLLGVSRKVLQYMHTLGMAYLLTGEQKYVDRAFLHLEAAANFPDWNPGHALDTGEMCAAFAVGYDWMYDAFTPAQRKVIEEGFYKNGICAANNLYEGVSGRVGAVYAESNWGAVVNGGIATGAMAFLDVYPENCSAILSNAVRGFDYLLWRFAPAGGWYEGPGYWEYTIKYTSKMLSNTKRILGTDFAFPLCEGFDKTVEYALSMQSSNGTFAYGDCMNGKYLVPEIFWMSDCLSKPEYTSSLLTLSEGNVNDYEDLALALCWYDVSLQNDTMFMSNDYWVKGEDVVSMRSGWGATDTFFAATAGTNGGGHDHLDSGGFVFDTGGVRWVTDLGQGNYNNSRYSYWDAGEDGDRWKIFQLRAEAHSTVVINPTTAPDQKLGSYTEITRFESGDNTSILTLDMSEALIDNASSATRAFALTDSKNSLVIRDEITLSDKTFSNEVYWLMMTEADVELKGNGAVLTKDGKTLYLNFSSDVEAEISVAPALSFDTTGVIDYGGSEPVTKRITIKMTSNDKVNITVTLSETPGTELLDSYNKSISLWVAV